MSSLNDRLDALTHKLLHGGSASGAGAGELVGEVKAWAGSGSIPLGYLLCNGQSVSRTAYAALFAVIGTTYGSADGASFNVPDCTDRTIYGSGGVVGAVGAAFGSASSVATHQHAHTATHGHGFVAQGHHGHGFVAEAPATNSIEPPNHGHVFGTGTVSADHGHSVNSVVFMNCSATHGHGGGCGQLAESPSYGGCTGFGCSGSTGGINTNHTHGGTTAGVNTGLSHAHTVNNHGHGFFAEGNHGHGFVAEAPGNTNDAGSANGNYPPGRVMRFLIRI